MLKEQYKDKIAGKRKTGENKNQKDARSDLFL
jgi:hypothetical protein